MARSRTIPIKFPFAGLSRRFAHQSQPPYTTPNALNVRPNDGVHFLGRRRGSSRPGVVAHFGGAQVGVGLMRLLARVEGFNPGTFHEYLDSFDRTAWGPAWSIPGGLTRMPELVDGFAYSDENGVQSGGVYNVIDFDTDRPYSLGLRVWLGHRQTTGTVIKPDGLYYLLLRMVDDAPVAFGAGATVIAVVLTVTTSGDTLTYNVKAYYDTSGAPVFDVNITPSRSSPEYVDFAVVSKGTSWGCYLFDQLVSPWTSVGGNTRHRAGFAIHPSTADSQCKVDRFWLNCYRNDPVPSGRDRVVASAAGNLSYENDSGQLVPLSTPISLSSDKSLQAASFMGKLFIAEHGDVRIESETGVLTPEPAAAWTYTRLDDGAVPDWSARGINGNIHVAQLTHPQGFAHGGIFQIFDAPAANLVIKGYPKNFGDMSFIKYRIERGPLVFDPVENTLSLWLSEAGKGFVPVGCPLICRYQGRIVMAGYPPHTWYMCRRGDPFDWDYGASASDPNRAVAGALSTAGVIGDPIKALIPAGDDYLLFGLQSQMHLMRGDPAMGGSIDVVSNRVGVIGSQAWCEGPNGSVYWVGQDRYLWTMRPGVDAEPSCLSANVIGNSFSVLSPELVNLEYDSAQQGVHIFCPRSESGSGFHWWYDLADKGFWPVAFGDTDCEPCASLFVPHAGMFTGSSWLYNNLVIMGGKTGKVFGFTYPDQFDNGHAFDSYVDLGPFRLGRDGFDGRLEALIASLGEVVASSDGPVAWEVRTGATAEEAEESVDVAASGVWNVIGLNPHSRMRVRGPWVVIRIMNGSTSHWSLESLLAHVTELGVQRVL